MCKQYLVSVCTSAFLTEMSSEELMTISGETIKNKLIGAGEALLGATLVTGALLGAESGPLAVGVGTAGGAMFMDGYNRINKD